uniref:phenylalanine--tRNA ligase n=1 Tax=Phaeomonas parva TaxID=124430 RepID=A0A7S1TPU5_9STRA
MATEDLEKQLLLAVDAAGCVEDSWTYAAENGVSHEALVGVLSSLEIDGLIARQRIDTPTLTLTEEGATYAAEGTPEFKLVQLVSAEGTPESYLNEQLGAQVVRFAKGAAMKNKWLRYDKKAGLYFPGAVAAEVDTVAQQLRNLDISPPTGNDLKTMKKRQLVAAGRRVSWKVSKGEKFATERRRRAADVTYEMLQSGAWQTEDFKPYNLNSVPVMPAQGYFHPLLKVRAEFRAILMQMGFSEMPTNKWVESSFWNFDSLFQPQSHPARDAHDTFFIKEPALTVRMPDDYYERVREVHENGGYGSIGHGINFKREEAFKNLLRTHTTAISAQMLYRLARDMEANGGAFEPKKYFSIDRVFRNETMDATHLCEFHQVEGLVADYNLSLGDLIGTIRTFFAKIGITQLRFKPAFNPYTEPSMEVFGYHPDLGKWTEIGNSGIFRPEMLRPMGLPEGVRVIAWGLSLERPTMIKYRVKNIRTLFGHKASVERTRAAPMCWFP